MKTKQIVLVTLVFALVSIGIDSIADNEINLRNVLSGVIQAIIFAVLFFTLGYEADEKNG